MRFHAVCLVRLRVGAFLLPQTLHLFGDLTRIGRRNYHGDSGKDRCSIRAEGTLRSLEEFILTEYRGLTVAQLKELRRALGAETEYAVVKNTLAAIAAKEVGINSFEGQLQGPSALAFIKGDLVDAAKGLRDFAKANPQLIVKTGYYEGETLTEDDVKRYADLESREVLLSKVAGGAKAAIARVAQAVDALRVKLEEQEGAAPAAAEEASEEA